MVREVKSENIAEVKDLMCKEKELFPKYLDSGLENIRLWYYLLDDKIVGIMGIEGNNHISITLTHEDYRQKGIARELFEAVKTILMAQAQFTITATATEDSKGFFQKLGFNQNNEKVEILTYKF